MLRAYMTVSTLACGLAVTAIPAPGWAGTYKLLYSFQGGNDGNNPYATLLDVGGILYGTTINGGDPGFGSVFSVNAKTSAETIVYSFQGGNDGLNPYAGLIKVGKKLYGTTAHDGYDGGGTVFSVNPATGFETVLYALQQGNDGAFPVANLLDVGGKLYGTASGGGGGDDGGLGVVYALDPKTGAETVVYRFKGGSDGSDPTSALINVGGTLYGTSYQGGLGNYGTVFSVNPTTGVETVLHAFQGGSDGLWPVSGLIKVGTKLYGTTQYGGESGEMGNGTVFSVNLDTGAEAVVYAFKGGSDGASPYGSLIKLGDNFYGTTYLGGQSNYGTVFSINPKTGAETVDYSFQSGCDGAFPSASLINVGGTLYGTTLYGGSPSCSGGSGFGTVFSFTP